MYNPEWDWAAQSSFVLPVAPPEVDPSSAPLVCVSFAQAWVPYIIGALMQLAQPAAWAAASAADLATVLQQAQELIESVGIAGGCTPVEFRLTSDCMLQYSTDGGATWTTVAGWVSFAAACFTGPAGAPGATGATGAAGQAGHIELDGTLVGVEPALNFIPCTGLAITAVDNPGASRVDVTLCPQPPPPTNPQGSSIDQQACNIAAYITYQVLKAAVQKEYDQVSAAQSLLSITQSVIGIIIAADLVIGLAVAAVTASAEIMLGGTLSDFSSALSTSSLWLAIQCALYNAILTTGYITPSNYAAVRAAINGVAWPHTDVQNCVMALVDGLGAEGLMALQNVGSAAVGDCSTCGVWCYEWDNAGHAALNSSGWTDYIGHAIYSGGVWNSNNTADPPSRLLYIQIPLDSTKTYTSVSFVFTGDPNSGGDIRFYSGAVGTTVLASLSAGHPATSMTWTGTVSGAHTLLLDITSTIGSLTVTQITLRGPGTNPFGVSNCS